MSMGNNMGFWNDRTEQSLGGEEVKAASRFELHTFQSSFDWVLGWSVALK